MTIKLQVKPHIDEFCRTEGEKHIRELLMYLRMEQKLHGSASVADGIEGLHKLNRPRKKELTG
jgi:hypothetical protein